MKIIKKTFRKLKIGIAVNPENYNLSYLKEIKNIVNIIYYDLVPRNDTIASCFTFTPAPVLQYTYGELTGMLYESIEQLGTIKGGSW